MAGEHLAKLTIQATLSHNDYQRGRQTVAVHFTLAGQVVSFYRGGDPGQFVVPDPDQAGETYALQAVQNVLALLSARIFALGLPYAVSAPRAGSPATIDDPNAAGLKIPVVEFDITATDYSASFGRNLDLDFSYEVDLSGGWAITQRVLNISPVFASATVTDATAYGAKDGQISVTARGGGYPAPGSFFYTWSDGGPGLPTRTGMGAGTYTCLIKDLSSPASTTLTVTVGSDARLDVQVQQVANNVHLVVSGGLAPYSYAWNDGPTVPDRTGLVNGTFDCTVTDSRGVQVTVQVTVLAYNLFYWSRNPVTLALVATDLATKPGLQFVLEVWLEQEYLSGVFVNIAGQLTQPADSAGATTFDVSTLLDAFVGPDFPAHGEVGLNRADKVFRRFYLQHSEQWTGSGPPTFTVRQTHYLVYGGLDFFEYAAGSYFTVYRPKVHPFLSWEPTQKVVLADQPEYLYYQHDSLSDDFFQLQVKFTTAAGLASTVALGSQSAVACFEVWRQSVGLAQLRAQLGALVPAGVVAWEVAAVNAGGLAVSETRYYQLSDELPATRRYFLYANSVAGVNTLAALGKAKTEVDYANVLVQRSLQPTYLADAGETFTTSVTGVPVLRCNTGYLEPTQMDAFQDFLLSEEIRFYDTDRYRPGSLQPQTTLPVADDDAALLGTELAFVLPTQRRYTPTLPLHY